MLFVLLLVGCSEPGAPIANEEPTQVIKTTVPATPTSLPTPTQIPPTETPTPPTSTPIPEPTALPLVAVVELSGSTGPVYSLEWSPDGQTLASAGHSQVNLWGEAWKQATMNGHSSYVWAVAWSPDGERLASGSQDRSLRIWDPANQVENAALGDQWVFSVAWSPDGNRLAAGTSRGVVQIWDVESGEMIEEFKPGNVSEAISLDWSPDGSTIAEGLLNGDILLWDADSGRSLNRITRYATRRADVNGLAWSHDGELLASAHQDGKIRIWNPESGQLVMETNGHGGVGARCCLVTRW